MPLVTIPPEYTAAILASPEDDAVRLVLADYLEEQGHSDHADFIRVQCKIADLDREMQSDEDCGYEQCPGCQERRALSRRERELLAADGPPIWGARTRFRDGVGETQAYRWMGIAGVAFDWVTFRRGFVAEVECKLADWLGARCVHCPDRAGYQHKLYPGGWETCEQCHGLGRTTGHGRAIVRAQPIEKIRVTDREPADCSDDTFAWYRDLTDVIGDNNPPRTPAQYATPIVLPGLVFDLLRGEVYQSYQLSSGHYVDRHYPSAPAAHAALSDALLRLVKETP